MALRPEPVNWGVFHKEQDAHMADLSDEEPFEEYEARMVESRRQRYEAQKSRIPDTLPSSTSLSATSGAKHSPIIVDDNGLPPFNTNSAASSSVLDPEEEVSARSNFSITRSSPTKSRAATLSPAGANQTAKALSGHHSSFVRSSIPTHDLTVRHDDDPHFSPFVEPVTSASTSIRQDAKKGSSKVMLSRKVQTAQKVGRNSKYVVVPATPSEGIDSDIEPFKSQVTTPTTSPLASALPPAKQAAIAAAPKPRAKRVKGELSKTALAKQQAALARELKAKKAAEEKAAAAAKKAEEKLELSMSAAEYVVHASQKFAEFLAKRPREKLQFRDMTVMYLSNELKPSERTRRRLDILAKGGATILSQYDPARVTHIIIPEDNPATNAAYTARFLGLKKVDDIPDEIKTINWKWMVESRKDILAFQYQPFAARIKLSTTSTKRKRAAPDLSFQAHDSDIEQYDSTGQARDDGEPLVKRKRPAGRSLVPTGPPAAPEAAPVNTDPLAEFYTIAAEMDDEDELASSDDGSDVERNPTESEVKAARARVRGSRPLNPGGKYHGFQCMSIPSTSAQGPCPNQLLIDKLSELQRIHEGKASEDDKWRAFSYRKAIGGLRRYPTKITTLLEARSATGVGKKTALKIMEILNTGHLKRIEYERTEDVIASNIFQGIYGVGKSVAAAWYLKGLRTLDDVRARKGGLKLTATQEIGLKYYDDINSRMPRAEAGEIYEKIKALALDIDPALQIEIMGSYRRGGASCGDIDLLITRPTTDGKTHQGVLRRLLSKLHKQGVLTDDLAMPDDFSALEAKYMGLCQLDSESPRRRIDILTIPSDQRGAALLYFTGDAIFNRSMRLLANKKGMSLNQRGLFGDVVRDSKTRVKWNEGVLLASKTEREIFDALGIPWQEPHERIRS